MKKKDANPKVPRDPFAQPEAVKHENAEEKLPAAEEASLDDATVSSDQTKDDDKAVKPRFRDDMLILSDEKSVGIFMHPLRQRMLEKMMILAEPVTSKHLADELGIAPSSARHHMLKLESIGVVERTTRS